MKLWRSAFVLILIVMIAGCGGGGSSSTDSSPPPVVSKSVSGVAATGSPIEGTVYLKDSSTPTQVMSTTINPDGSFSFDVTGLTAPFMLKAVGTANGQPHTLYSLAGDAGIANINPLSHLAVVRANNGADPAQLFTNLNPAQVQAIKAALVTVIPQIRALLQQALSQYGVSATNFITDTYVANHMGLDLFFDMIAIATNNGTMTMSNKASGATIITTTLTGSTLNGQIVSANIPTIMTQTAGAVYIYPTSATISTGSTATFKSLVIGKTNQAVTWSVVEPGGGNITSAGVYTAPASAGTYHVKATSVADASKSTTVTVTVTTAATTPEFGPFTDAMFANRMIWGDGSKIFTADHKVLFVLDSPISTIGTWAVSNDNVLTITTTAGATSYKFLSYAGDGAFSIKNIAKISNITDGTTTDWQLQTFPLSSFSTSALFSGFAAELGWRTLTVSLLNGTPATLKFNPVGIAGSSLTVSGVTAPFTWSTDAKGNISVVTSTGTIKITAAYPPSEIAGGAKAFPLSWTAPNSATYYGTGVLQ